MIKIKIVFYCSHAFGLLKPAAHREERAEQTASQGGLLSRFLTCAGKFWNFGMKKKLYSTMSSFGKQNQVTSNYLTKTTNDKTWGSVSSYTAVT